jgi:hypothetical protein
VIAHGSGGDEILTGGLVMVALALGWVAVARLRGRGFDRLPRWGAVVFVITAVALVTAPTVVQRVQRARLASAPKPPATSATVTIRSPRDAAIITGDTMDVVIDLDGGRVVEASGPVRPDTGHLHLTIDGVVVSMTYGEEQMIDVSAFEPGEHELVAEFVAADHRSFTPPATDSASFTLESAP